MARDAKVFEIGVYIIGGYVARCCLFDGSILGKIGGLYDIMCGINFPPIDTPLRELSVTTTNGCRADFWWHI